MADQRPPSFFHILMNPSSPYLPLPLKFVTKHLRKEKSDDTIIKSANGGYLWKLKMKKFDDQSYCLVDGWCNVVKDVSLLFGEFLLFKYVGSSVFLMHAYSVNGCEKILVPKIKVVDYEVEEVEKDVVYDVHDDEMDVDGDNGDPFFILTSSKSNRNKLVHFSISEDKFCLAKITKKKTSARPLPPAGKAPVTKVVDGMDDQDVDDNDGKDVVVGDNNDEDENVDDGMDVDADDTKDEANDAEFVVTITPIHKRKLVLPKKFVVLAGIESKENIIMKSLDGNETKFSIRTDKRHRSTYYYLSVGWPAFKRSNNLSEGDKCVFKYITSEDRLCLAKFTKKKTETRLPSPAKVVKRKRGQLPPVTENKMTAAENVKTRSSRRPAPVEITVAQAVKRKRGGLPPSSPRVTKHVKRKKGVAEGVDEGVNVAKQRRGRLAK